MDIISESHEVYHRLSFKSLFYTASFNLLSKVLLICHLMKDDLHPVDVVVVVSTMMMVVLLLLLVVVVVVVVVVVAVVVGRGRLVAPLVLVRPKNEI